jgi:hypothetical protein
MSSSLVLFALAGMFTPAISEEPQWYRYGDALRRSEQENKPVAVFIGTGKKGWEKISENGKFNRSIEKQLTKGYVCVYVDAKEESKLASAFEMDGPGLVISSAGGRLQAFRHEGHLANDDLENHLARFADPERVVRQTEDTAAPRMSYYQAPPQAYQQPYPYQLVPSFTGGACRT